MVVARARTRTRKSRMSTILLTNLLLKQTTEMV